MKKRLRKKLRVGEFQHFYFRATLSVQAGNKWPSFTAALADFMSDTWRHWGFGYGETGSERRFLINVGTREEADSRRTEMIHWLEQRDDVRLVSAAPVDLKARVYRLRRQG
jgi:uncharacterized protein YggL (DUF469 family)